MVIVTVIEPIIGDLIIPQEVKINLKLNDMAIRLEKGQRINLEKESGTKLTNFCVGCNWGAIIKKTFFGLSTSVVDVDLEYSEQVRRWWPFLRDRRIDSYGNILRRYVD